MLIRDYTDADWDQVRPILADVVTAADTFAYDPDWPPETVREVWVERPPGRTSVAVDHDGAVRGTAKMGPNRPGRGAHVATGSVMVAPERSGRGAGRLLGEEIVRWARDAGFRGIQFNAVVETNHRAVALWLSLGFQVVGTVPGAFRHADGRYVGLHVMYLDLTSLGSTA